MYYGTIIEESLEDTSILKQVKIISTKIEPVTPSHKTPWIKQWTLHEVEISDDKIDDIAEQVVQKLDSQHAWYADFKNDKYHYIIFRNKIFKVDRSQMQQYEPVTKYGLKLNIPSYQLNFSTAIRQWEREKN